MKAVDLVTGSQNVIFLNVKNNEVQSRDGAVYHSNFALERLFDGSDDYFGNCSKSYICTIKKTKHAWIYIDEHCGKEPNTFLDFAELKEIDNELAGKPLYVLPLVEGFSDVMREVGGNKIQDWFETEESFISVFNSLHKLYGNDPEKFIF